MILRCKIVINYIKHGIGRYLLQLVDVFLGNETPNFKFQRPKKVINVVWQYCQS